MAYLFAALAAIANAISSVLQRKANQDQPSEDNLSPRLIVDLLHNPTWFLGICGVIAGFLLQAAALSSGALSVVEPILIFELPTTLLLAGIVFHRRLHRREWLSAAAMTAGLGALLYLLSPSAAEPGEHLPAAHWAIGIAVNLTVIAALVGWARRSAAGSHRAALLGVSAGAAFGLTAALIKAMTGTLTTAGFFAVFTVWQTYAMIAAGALAMFLLQSSLNAGSLVAAQPGITATDPVVSILWGTLAFGESVRGGIYVLLEVVAAALIGAGIVGLSRSPLVSGDEGASDSTSAGHPAGRLDEPGQTAAADDGST